MTEAILIANRGEIAVRIARTLRGMGVRSIAVYTPADARSLHVAQADEAIAIGSYLSVAEVVEAAIRCGATALHPGYGFLSENAALARECERSGIVFVGPPIAAIAAMGDKIQARRIAESAGVCVVPGSRDAGMTDEQVAEAAVQVGFPVLLKPSAGGGGKGMRRVDDADALDAAIASARREARTAFGDDTLLVERYVESPRHIEIQVLADTHGTVVHLGERECSLQRRHQKVIEEAPSPLVDAALRSRMGDAAVSLARTVGYVGAGTVEFMVDGHQPSRFYFLEMNTRLQVEHPVTEAVTGLDLVEWQVRIAAGERLGFAQDDVRLSGHALEARVYAEDPARGFLPTGGRLLAWSPPADARVDSGVCAGDVIGSAYDPLLAKVIVHGESRAQALGRLDRALASTTALGFATNIGFLRALARDEHVLQGDVDTGLIDRLVADGWGEPAPAHVIAAAALRLQRDLAPSSPARSRWAVPDGWRVGEHAPTAWRLQVDGAAPIEARVRPGLVSLHGGAWLPAALDGDTVHLAGRSARIDLARDGDSVWVGEAGRAWEIRAAVPGSGAQREHASGAGPLRSPMPGTVIDVRVEEGSAVSQGQPLVVVEAMKMEHALTAPVDGIVSDLAVAVGDAVRLDQVVLVVRSASSQGAS